MRCNPFFNEVLQLKNVNQTIYTREEIINRTFTELNLEVALITYAQMVQQFQANGALHNREFEIRTKFGDRRTVLLSSEQIELSGTPCTLNIINDITEYKRLENEFPYWLVRFTKNWKIRKFDR